MSSPAVPVARAEVHAGGVRTEYLRAGQGAPVLLLAADGAEGAMAHALIGELARHRRVIAPAMAGAADGVPAMLGDLLEGLGIERAAIVALGALARPALAFAASRPASVSGVVLLAGAAALAALAADPLAESLARAGVGLLTRELAADGDAAAPDRLAGELVALLA